MKREELIKRKQELEEELKNISEELSKHPNISWRFYRKGLITIDAIFEDGLWTLREKGLGKVKTVMVLTEEEYLQYKMYIKSTYL